VAVHARVGHDSTVLHPRPNVHARVHRSQWAFERFGELATRSFAALERTDPVADHLVEWLATQSQRFDLTTAWQAAQAGEPLPDPVAALFDSVRVVPAWVDWRCIDRARRPFERTGVFGGLVLSLRSLMGGYSAPAGNKPLAFSGRLREQAPRRVAETARFVTAVCAPGGMRPGAEGWRITLHVRLMHAQVRRLLWASGRWDRARWAEPINQHDMLATMLLFSEVYIEGLRVFAFSISDEEAEDWIHLWRLVAWVMGTEEALLPVDYAEASALRELIQQTQGPPDADSRALAVALLGASPLDRLAALRHGMARGISRMLIGDEVADALGIERALGWGTVLPLVPIVVGASEQVRTRVPAIEQQLRAAGAHYWAWVVEASLRGQPAQFARPDRLATPAASRGG
jgi:hypothetical protein